MSQDTNLLLIGESFSPWTKKARWALEYCNQAYEYKEYTPTISEPGLRLRLKQWSGSVSVPVLFVGEKIYRGSWEIACFANETVGDNRLGNMEKIKSWNGLSEAALEEGRTEVVRRIMKDNQALEESLPALIPKLLRRHLKFLSYDAVRRLDKKYAHLVKPGSLRQALITTRKGLASSGCDYLLGDFSYADMTMAVVQEVIAPVAKSEPPLGTATQRCWNNQELASEFNDLMDWRDRLALDSSTTYSQFRNCD